MKVKVTIEFTDEQIRDLIITGFESGTYGSFIIEDYDAPEGPLDPETGWPHEKYPGYAWWALEEGTAVLVYDKYEYTEWEYDMRRGEATEDDKPPLLRLDRAACERGLQLLSDKAPYLFNTVREENYDVFGGDGFLQCALLGDVIYG